VDGALQPTDERAASRAPNLSGCAPFDQPWSPRAPPV
jgi:hypothetical protein